jgi:hypothetical protein
MAEVVTLFPVVEPAQVWLTNAIAGDGKLPLALNAVAFVIVPDADAVSVAVAATPVVAFSVTLVGRLLAALNVAIVTAAPSELE